MSMTPRYILCPNPDCLAVYERGLQRHNVPEARCPSCEEALVADFTPWHPRTDPGRMPPTVVEVLEALVDDCLDTEASQDENGRLYGVFVDAIRYLVRDAGRNDIAYTETTEGTQP